MKRCHCCGQVIPPVMTLPPVIQRIYDTLRDQPRTAEELRDIIWRDDPDGGPLSRHTIYVHIDRLKRRLKPLGLGIRSGGFMQPYFVVAL